jgi:hypothetical protein
MRIINPMFAAGLAALVVIGMISPGIASADQIPLVSTVVSPVTSVLPAFYGGFEHGGYGLFGGGGGYYGDWGGPGYYWAPAYGFGTYGNGYGTCGWNGYYW